jgi:TatD DNase family protein
VFVLHCYMGSQLVTKEFLNIPNIYFSFTGNITYPVKIALRGGNFDFTKSAELIPIERIFVETDCPFLAPQSKRGKRNEPAFVCEVAVWLADQKKMPVEKLENILQDNFQRVFFGALEIEDGSFLWGGRKALGRLY